MLSPPLDPDGDIVRPREPPPPQKVVQRVNTAAATQAATEARTAKRRQRISDLYSLGLSPEEIAREVSWSIDTIRADIEAIRSRRVRNAVEKALPRTRGQVWRELPGGG